MNLDPIANVRGLPDEELDLLNELLDVWRRKQGGNNVKIRYYEMRIAVKDLGSPSACSASAARSSRSAR